MMPGVLSRSTSTLRRVALASALPVLLAACAGSRARDTVVYASGADLESANPLVTIHSLSRQLQRYALFVTLARYDAALRPRPYFARSWAWSADRRTLTLRLEPGLRWHDGRNYSRIPLTPFHAYEIRWDQSKSRWAVDDVTSERE